MEKSLKEKIEELLPANAVVLLGVVDGPNTVDICTLVSQTNVNNNEDDERRTKVLALAFSGAMTSMGNPKELGNFVRVGGRVMGLLTELQEAEKEDDNVRT